MTTYSGGGLFSIARICIGDVWRAQHEIVRLLPSPAT